MIEKTTLSAFILCQGTMTWGAEQKTAKDKIKVKARNTTRQSLKIIAEIFSEGKTNLSITMAAYFHSPATPPSSSSFLILLEITVTSLIVSILVKILTFW